MDYWNWTLSYQKLYKLQTKIQETEKKNPRLCRNFQRLLYRTSEFQLLIIHKILQIQFKRSFRLVEKKSIAYGLCWPVTEPIFKQKRTLQENIIFPKLISKEYRFFLTRQIMNILWVFALSPILENRKKDQVILTGLKSSQIYKIICTFLKKPFQYLMISEFSNFFNKKNKYWILSNLLMEKKFFFHWLKSEKANVLSKTVQPWPFQYMSDEKTKDLGLFGKALPKGPRTGRSAPSTLSLKTTFEKFTTFNFINFYIPQVIKYNQQIHNSLRQFDHHWNPGNKLARRAMGVRKFRNKRLNWPKAKGGARKLGSRVGLNRKNFLIKTFYLARLDSTPFGENQAEWGIKLGVPIERNKQHWVGTCAQRCFLNFQKSLFIKFKQLARRAMKEADNRQTDQQTRYLTRSKADPRFYPLAQTHRMFYFFKDTQSLRRKPKGTGTLSQLCWALGQFYQLMECRQKLEFYNLIIDRMGAFNEKYFYNKFHQFFLTFKFTNDYSLIKFGLKQQSYFEIYRRTKRGAWLASLCLAACAAPNGRRPRWPRGPKRPAQFGPRGRRKTGKAFLPTRSIKKILFEFPFLKNCRPISRSITQLQNPFPNYWMEYYGFLLLPLTKNKNYQVIHKFCENYAQIHGLHLKFIKLFSLSQGISFLGWFFQKKVSPLTGSISRANIQNHQKELKFYFKTPANKNKPIDHVIYQLNQKILYWQKFYNCSIKLSKGQAARMNAYLFWLIWYWLKKRHRTRSSKWLYNRYWKKSISRKWRFSDNHYTLIFYNL